MPVKAQSTRHEALTQKKVRYFAEVLVQTLPKISLKDALRVFNEAIFQVIRNSTTKPCDKPVKLPIANLKRRASAGRVAKIEADPEIKAFIHQLRGYHSYPEIARLCAHKFGKKRAPSKSAVGRYIKKISDEEISPEKDKTT
ncbi:MAG: hypothetical protein AB2777_22375 [Candidatus Thiodiazotropha endolucinida]